MKGNFKLFLIDYQKLLRAFIDSIKKILWFLARDAFLFTMVLVLLAIVFGEFLFYNYVLSVEIKEINVDSDIIRFKEGTYESVVQEWKNREDIFNSPLKTDYQNPFIIK